MQKECLSSTGAVEGNKDYQQRAFTNPKIEFVWHSVVDEILGGDMVESLTVRDVRDHKTTSLDVDGVLSTWATGPIQAWLKTLLRA